jgi:hypothetical protein
MAAQLRRHQGQRGANYPRCVTVGAAFHHSPSPFVAKSLHFCPLARKGSSSSLARGGEEETQEEAPGAKPQFLLHGCEVPRLDGLREWGSSGIQQIDGKS